MRPGRDAPRRCAQAMSLSTAIVERLIQDDDNNNVYFRITQRLAPIGIGGYPTCVYTCTMKIGVGKRENVQKEFGKR